MLASTHCLDCGTELSQERWSGGLCPRCLLVMALDESPSSGPDRLTEAPTLAFPPTTIAPGEIPGDRYRVHSLLGRGGMGEVWRAFDLKLRVDVALKALRKELLEDSHALELLRQEVRAAREVMSPNVCRVFDLEELDGQELVSMEYIDGTTLLEILRDRGPLELEEAREIASQFLAGLEAIHLAGLVHRDVKPENIMLTRSGRVVVMDFGVAKRLADGKLGSVAGTPAYMAPEQVKGKQVDARADVFSAGVVLAEMIAPEGIGSSEARENVWRGIHHDPPELPESPWLGVVKRAVTPSLEERYESASVLARALEEVTLRIEGAEEVQPYPGLAAFTEEDAEYFFGRELEVEEMWKKLRRPHLLALIGPSGAGKSSFLRAGLIPTIPEGWRVVISTPGNRPFRALAQRLVPEFEGDTEAMTALLDLEEMEVAVPLVARWRERHKQALVIVDQFEELFTQNPPEVQGRFAELLGRLALEADVHVLLSMRDDFLYHCHRYPSLTPLLDGLTLLSPPTGSALRRAVVQPALKCGYRFEDEELVDEILTEVEEERGAMPMLAFSAARMWEKRNRESGLLTREAYGEIGGVSGALAQHAEATLERIGSDRISIVREIFRNLVTAQGTRAARDRDELLSVFEGTPTAAGTDVGEGLVPSRAGTSPAPTTAVTAASVGDRDVAAQVLNTLIDARLLTSYDVPPAEEEDTGHHRIEIIHESLLSNWPRLVRWQSQDADSALLRGELRQAAQMWDQHDRADDLLWTGTAFREFQLWRERYPGGLSELEEEFSRAMTNHATRRRRRRRIAVATVIAILLGVVGIVGALWRRSEESRRQAEAAHLFSLGQLELGLNHSAAIAYAIASLELIDSPDVRVFALEALWRGPTAFQLPIDATPWGLDFSPNGQWLAVGAWGGKDAVSLLSRDGEVYPPFIEHKNNVRVWFSPDSEVLVSRDGELTYWMHSVPDGREIRRLEAGSRIDLIETNRLLTWSKEEEDTWLAQSWPLDGGEPTEFGRWHVPPSSRCTKVDPTGLWLACFEDRDLYLVPRDDVAGTTTRRVGSHQRTIGFAVFHPDGRQLVTRDSTLEFQIWSREPDNSRPVRTIETSLKSVERWGVDPTGSLFATVSVDERARVWDLEGPPGADPLEFGLEGRIVDHAFHPSGEWLATGNEYGPAIWPLRPVYPRVFRGHEDLVIGVVFAPDSSWIASASADGTIRWWPLTPGGGSNRLIFENPLDPGVDELFNVVVDPAGQRLMTAGCGGHVWVLPLTGGAPHELIGGEGCISAIALSPDGHLAVAAAAAFSKEKVFWIWELESGAVRVLDPGNDENTFTHLEFTSDGRLVSAGWGPGAEVRLWNLDDGTYRVLRQGEMDSFNATQDGRYVLTGEIEEMDAGFETKLIFHDLEQDQARHLAAHGTSVLGVALDPKGEIAVSGDRDGVVRVGPVTGEEPHLLLGHEGDVWDVEVSPDGRWIASASADGTVRLWPMPDLDKPPFHTLPYEELLAKLRSLTNLRAVEDPTSPTGYKIEPGPFPGWEQVPTW